MPMDFFGFSGGAQLAHRFAMLYPEAVGDLHLGAAGWYTMPQESTVYPYGIQDSLSGSRRWSRLMRSGLDRFLRRNITVYVGEKDTERDDTLRKNRIVDEQQGLNRIERARSYVALLNRLQSELGVSELTRMELLPECDHRFSICAAQGNLAGRVLNAL